MIGAVHGYLDQRLDPAYRLPAPGKKKKIEE
jgi:hypothetical protein